MDQPPDITLSLETRPIAADLPDEIWQQVVRFAPKFIAILRPDLTCVFTSAAVAAVSGFTPAEILGVDFTNFVHPGERVGLRHEIDAALASGMPMDVTMQFADGDWHILNVSVSQLEAEGEPFLLFVGQDVTDERQAIIALRRKAQLESLLESLQRRLLNAHGAATRPIIDTALGELCHTFGADHATITLERIADGMPEVFVAHEWTGVGVDASGSPHSHLERPSRFVAGSPACSGSTGSAHVTVATNRTSPRSAASPPRWGWPSPV
jgi:PAS domain S-box-containing protein